MPEPRSGHCGRLLRFASLLLAIVFAIGPATPAEARRKKKDDAKASHTVSEKVAKKLSPALEALTNGEDEEAFELLTSLEKRADRISPYERALVYQMLGFLYNEREDFVTALTYFEKCLAQEALPPGAQLQTRFNVAQLYMAIEEYEKAAATLDIWFSEVEKPAPGAYYLLAVAHYQSGNIQPALEAAEKAVEIATTVKEPWLQLLVGLYYEAKQYEKAQQPLEALIMLNPRKAYWTQLSSLYAHLELEQKSLAVMQLAYEQDFLESDLEIRQLAQLYLYHSIPYRAATALEKGLADGFVEEDVDVFAMIANSWLLAREYEKSLVPLRKAAEMSPEGDLYARLGQVLLDRERWKLASDALSAAVAKGGLTDPGTTNLMLGMALYYQKRPDRARKYFARALSAESSRESATQWLLLLDRELAANPMASEPEAEPSPEVEATQDGPAPPAAESQPENDIS